jgi:hypothetical protein
MAKSEAIPTADELAELERLENAPPFRQDATHGAPEPQADANPIPFRREHGGAVTEEVLCATHLVWFLRTKWRGTDFWVGQCKACSEPEQQSLNDSKGV